MTARATTLPGSIVPTRVGRVLLVVCSVAVVYGTAATVPHIASVRGVAAWLSTMVFLLAFTVAVERWESPAPFLVSGIAGVAMQYLAPGNGAFVAVIAVIAVAGIRLSAQDSRRIAALTGVAFLGASAAGSHPLPPAQLVSVVPALLFTYLGATAMRRLRAEQQRSETLLQEVIAGRDARIRAAALDERARLAREMHDVLAHTLSALSIQLEGARMLAEQRSADAALVSALERSSGLAKEGLGEARRAVKSLRGDSLPGPDMLSQLAEEFERDTGVPCELRIEGKPIDLSAEARLALYRIAHEALTNIRKHANASGVTIALRYDADCTELAVENEGAPLASPLPGGGYGISGMRERAELLGGRLEAGPTAAGFKIWLWLPKENTSQSAS